MSDLPNYSFLDVISESEAAARGVSLSDKLIHALYKTIKLSSNSKSAKRGTLYTIDIAPLDLEDPPKNEKLAALRKLIRENLITQIYRLDHQGGMKLNIVSCFVSIGEEDRNDLHEIYRETIARSVESIERLLVSLPPFNPAIFKKELDIDLNHEGISAPDSSAISSSIPGVLDGVAPGRFEIVPNPDLLVGTKNDITEELIARGKFIMIPGYGLLPVQESSIVDRFLVAVEFMDERIIPLYRNRGNLSRRLDDIASEEAAYLLDEFAPRNATFSAKRAAALAEAMDLSARDQKRKWDRMPGALAIHVIMLLETRTNEKFKERKAEEFNRILAELKNKMLDPAASWDQMIVFLTNSDYIKLPPAVRDGLASDRRILYGNWQQPNQIIHVFLRNDPYAFRALVMGMSKLPPEYFWQVLAMRHLLDRYDEHFENLFRDPEFTHLYGRLLRNVYISHMPWFYRFLLWLGVRVLQDKAFQHAKNIIQNQQSTRAIQNKEAAEKERVRIENERRLRLSGLREKSMINSIIEQLDQFYFQWKKIPSVMDLIDRLPEMNSQRLREILAKDNFQILPANKGENPDDAIVLYPVDQQWRSRAARLRRIADDIKESLRSRPDGDFEKRLIESRADRVLKKLNRSIEAARTQSTEKDASIDPYRRFESELKNYEESRKSSSSPSQKSPVADTGGPEDSNDPYFDDL